MSEYENYLVGIPGEIIVLHGRKKNQNFNVY